jgi:DegV family protein with EDD domain
MSFGGLMIKLMADSTCDLSDAFLEEYDISMAALSIIIEGQSYKDRIDIQPNALYNMLGTLKDLPTTAMPSPTEYIDIIEASIDKGYTDILCICMSSGTSGSYQSALLAWEYFKEKYGETPYKMHVVDSKCMSHGSGYLLLKSALLRAQGATFDELVDFNETYKTNVKHLLSVDDLDNLIKSGRLTNVSAMIGKVLKVKPIMSMRNGKGAIVAKVRGSKKVFAHYVESFTSRVDLELTDFVIIGYTSDQTVAENMKLKLVNETGFAGDVHIMQMGVSVGTHVGLGALSMYFFEKGDRHDGLVYNEMGALLEKKNEMMKLIRSLKDKS